MKKLLSLVLSLLFIISININSYAINTSTSVADLKIKGVNLISNAKFNINSINEHGFNLVFLNVDNIRNPQKPYNTNYKALKLLYTNIAKLERDNIKYVLCFSSGPGYSGDGKINSIFKNSLEISYFSKMVKEILGRYYSHDNFMAASINLMDPNARYDKFYSAQNNIISNIRLVYRELPFIYNYHPLAFEDNFRNVPAIKLTNIIGNLSISLKGLSYPGYGAGFKNSCSLNKNSLLSNLENIKDYQNSTDNRAIITLKTPWVDNSEVLLQDLFEIYRILKFNYVLSYGNSNDIYDLTSNTDVLKVLDRNNR